MRREPSPSRKLLDAAEIKGGMTSGDAVAHETLEAFASKRHVGRSEVIVVAEVTEVEPADQLQPWSGGLISSRQFVQYKVKKTLKGEVPDGKIRVAFMLVENSLTADESRPRLSPELFRDNNVHILFLNRDRQPSSFDKKQAPWLAWLSYKGVSSNYGAVMYTAEAEAKVRALSSAPKVAEGKEQQ